MCICVCGECVVEGNVCAVGGVGVRYVNGCVRCMRVCICICMYMYECVYTYTYIYVYFNIIVFIPYTTYNI